jgi:hypothetical protein
MKEFKIYAEKKLNELKGKREYVAIIEKFNT